MPLTKPPSADKLFIFAGKTEPRKHEGHERRKRQVGRCSLSHEVGIQYSRDISRRWEMSYISKLGKITILCIDVGIQDKGVMYRGW